MVQITIIKGIGQAPVAMYATGMKTDYYVYAHVRHDTGKVFYVGKGRARRAFVANGYHRSVWWLRTVEKAGGFDVLMLHEGLTEAEAFDLERQEIASFRQSGCELVNLTDGGDGASGAKRSDEWRAMMSAVHKGKIVSEETRAKLSIAVRNSSFVQTGAAAARARYAKQFRAYKTGFTHSEETKRKMSAAHKGNKSRLGQVRSAEERAKVSKAMLGRKQARITCPHCQKTGGNGMRRYHFEHCKAVQNGD